VPIEARAQPARNLRRLKMKIQTNIRAGAGKAAGGGATTTGGGNSKSGADNTVAQDPVAPAPVYTYVPPVSRCVGI
jgi:hypothetical protein